MKKAFTLVELITVIAILSVVLVIAVPKVVDVLNTSNNETYITSAKKLVELSKIYTAETMNFNSISVLDTSKLEYDTGLKPTSGQVQTNSSDQTRIAVVFNNYCVTKAYTSTTYTVTKMTSSSTCTLP